MSVRSHIHRDGRHAQTLPRPTSRRRYGASPTPTKVGCRGRARGRTLAGCLGDGSGWLVAVTAAGRRAAGAAGAGPEPAAVARTRTGTSSVAIGLADSGRYGQQSLHWPPGAPVAFAAAAKLDGRVVRGRGARHPGGVLGAVAGGTALIPLVFALATTLGGAVGRAGRGGARGRDLPAADRGDRRPALRAARGAVADRGDARARPPPLRARRGAAGRRGADAGEPARADPGARAAARAAPRRGVRRRRARARGAVVAERVGAGVDRRRQRVLRRHVPARRRDARPATKQALKAETIRARPEWRGAHAKDLPGDVVLDAVAARHPDLDRDAALRAEAWRNLRTYPARTRPATPRCSRRSSRGCGCGPRRAATGCAPRRCGSGTR